MEEPEVILRDWFGNSRLEHYDKYQVILRPDEEPVGVYLIENGYVKNYNIAREGFHSLIAIYGPANLFPLHWALDGGEEVFYETMTEVACRKMGKSEFQSTMNKEPALSQLVIDQLIRRFQDYKERIQNLELKTAREKIICRILFLADNFGAPLKDGQIIVMAPVTHHDLADSLNMTRETANREVSSLTKEGFIKKRRGQLIILDKKKLSQELG